MKIFLKKSLFNNKYSILLPFFESIESATRLVYLKTAFIIEV
ncbi:hypothetical protein RV18_GL000558 [Enterococcus termitis]|nr:hypothetical protein RV18_GL000558 [Enterococcus termitis]